MQNISAALDAVYKSLCIGLPIRISGFDWHVYKLQTSGNHLIVTLHGEYGAEMKVTGTQLGTMLMHEFKEVGK